MRTITFPDGGRMPWPLYRSMMNGELSPAAAVARSRRAPVVGALDAALPRRLNGANGARDQNGRLDGSYVRATAEYLRAAGLAQEDLDAIGKILDGYVDEEAAEDAENLQMRPDPKIGVGGPRGTVGAADRRRVALDQLDQFGQPRSNLARAMAPTGDRGGFFRRFPEADRIRTL